MDSSRVGRGDPGQSILVSCLGDDDTGGGLSVFNGETIEVIDRISTTGLWADGERLIRVLWGSSERQSAGELLVYDRQGVRSYHRLDQLVDPHDVLWHGHHYVCVSSFTNSVLWVNEAGQVDRIWRAAGEEDSFHLNSLVVHQGRLYVTCFGRFEKRRQWREHLQNGDGCVFDPESGATILTGLSAPHHPRFVDGKWIVCNSARREVVEIDGESGILSRRLQLAGWTRGLAITDDYIFVGESANRHDAHGNSTASIVTVCRKTWRVLNRVELPWREVYDLVVVSPALLEGVKRGFRTNSLRVAEQDQLSLFQQVGVQPTRLWATGERLPPSACKIRIEADVPTDLPAETTVAVDCQVKNLGTAILVSAPPNPVNISYRWRDRATGTLIGGEGLRTHLSRSLPPGSALECRVSIVVPRWRGKAELAITAVQEEVAWFEDIDEANALRALISVTD
ncbi:MAG TPA: DUF4915 domain-containing protein [Chloroflexota bacterium]|nr:DUF4915 domain-containing protein [Chloroflexota bacterium]